MAILPWYNRFVESGCVSHRQPSQGRPCVPDGTTENGRQTFVVRSPRKSIKRASLKLNVSKTTMWKILKKRLRCKPYTLQLVQALSDGNKAKRQEYCGEMSDKMENEDDYPNKIVDSNKDTFHLSGKVHRYNTRRWGRKNSHEIAEYVWNSPKLNFCVCVLYCENVRSFLLHRINRNWH